MKDFWKVPAILLAATLMLRNTKEGGRMPKYIFPLLVLIVAIVAGAAIMWRSVTAERLADQRVESVNRQLSDVVRVVQDRRREEAQRQGAQVRERVAQPWVRAMDAWYRAAGREPVDDRLVWHEDRLEQLERLQERVRALEEEQQRRETRSRP